MQLEKVKQVFEVLVDRAEESDYLVELLPPAFTVLGSDPAPRLAFLI